MPKAKNDREHYYFDEKTDSALQELSEELGEEKKEIVISLAIVVLDTLVKESKDGSKVVFCRKGKKNFSHYKLTNSD